MTIVPQEYNYSVPTGASRMEPISRRGGCQIKVSSVSYEARKHISLLNTFRVQSTVLMSAYFKSGYMGSIQWMSYLHLFYENRHTM